MYVTASEDVGDGAAAGAMIKIMDYDLARVNYSPEWEGSTPCGTVHYMAPEVVRRGKYTLSIDCWSLGVLLYILLSGCMPFTGHDDKAIEKAIEKGEYILTGELWDEVSEEAKDLVKNLLKMDPSERYTAVECLGHPWLALEMEEEVDDKGVVGSRTPAVAIAGQKNNRLSSPERSLRTVENLRQLSESLRGSKSGGLGSSFGANQHLSLKSECEKEEEEESVDVVNLRLALDLIGTEAGIVDSVAARATGAGKGLVELPGSPRNADQLTGGGKDEFADLDASFVEEEHAIAEELGEED
jgi:serine/threonine protein kinase